ncbi:MAG: hypothetical protein R3F04_10435 [Lysobacteraceae bacterium]
MKKSSLTTAVVAGIAGVAGLVSVSNAVNINPDGLGQVLIYPYYTVNGGNATLISVVNTTDEVKAVKVRFLEGRNSQEVLDFNLYLSPFDVWTGAVTGAAEGSDPVDASAAVLTTEDTSCTVPAIPAAGQSFVNFEYAFNNDDGGPYENSRTREGHIEMIEMGRVTGSRATAATHGASGVPANCGTIRAAWDAGGAWSIDPDDGILSPNGGLFGGAEIVDVVNGTNISYNADAIDGFFVSASGATLHANPGTTDPSLEDAQSDDLGNAVAVVFHAGTLFQFNFDAGDHNTPGLKAVSAVFMHDEIYNEYVTGGGFASEWVVTFPTKGLHLERTVASGDRLPFISSYVGDDNTPLGACEPISFAYWNREEQRPQGGGVGFSPPPPGAPGLSLCYEAQVVTYTQDGVNDVYVGGNQSSVLGSYFARNINLLFAEGWARMGMGDGDNVLIDSDLNSLQGLPVTGFWASRVTQDSGSGSALANFSIVHKHRSGRAPSTGTP